MATLSYTAICSLDGFISDTDGNFDWAAPDEEVHRFINNQECQTGTFLLGRRMYETLRYWETVDTTEPMPEAARDYAQIWRAAEKVVYSRTLTEVASERTTIKSEFSADAVRELKATCDRDLGIGGAACWPSDQGWACR